MIGAPEPMIEALETLEEGNLLLLEPRERFDQCIVGVGMRFHDTFVLYDRECVIRVKVEDILSDPDWDDEDGERDAHLEALEDFEFNTIGGWVGEHTPGFVVTDPEAL